MLGHGYGLVRTGIVVKRRLQRLGDFGVVLLPVIVLGGLVAAYLVFAVLRELVPPQQVSMAAGRPGGAYHAIAERYRAILARDGIDLLIIETAGSVENARLLADGRAETAIIQGGVSVAEGASVEALAAVFLEPFLIFHRRGTPDAGDPSAWPGLRVAVGEPGSGTRMAVEALARGLGIGHDPERLIEIGGADAVAALLSDAVDVAVFVAPLDAPYLAPLMSDPDIRLSSPRDAPALARRFAFVRSVDIPRSGLDYAARLPAERVEVTAMIATLAAASDLHPALVNRFVRAAQEIHSGPVLLSDTLRFPSPEGTGLAMNPQAVSVLASGRGALDGVLPYWITAQVTRVTLLIVPLLVVLPLLRMLPNIYEWRMRSRVYRRYTELVAIDAEAEGALTDDRRAMLLDHLDAIDREAKAVQVPPRYREYVYTLRLHIDLVRRKLTEARRA